MHIVSLFCEIDDFFLAYQSWQETQCLPDEIHQETRGRQRGLHSSEVMTICVAFQQSGYRTLKHFYLKHVCTYWRKAFPGLVSYSRFVQLQQEVLEILRDYLFATLGECSGVSFVDSTRLCVCDNKRISAHRVFHGAAERSKTSMGWFYGFKLHLLINDVGDLLDVALTPGKTDDRQLLETFAQRLHGSLYGDRGYISQDIREWLREAGINLVYKVRRNMDPLPLSDTDAVLLKKRTLIESVIKELKTQTGLAHTRHRSLVNFQVNVLSALIAYQLSEKKPSLNFDEPPQTHDLLINNKN